MDKFIKLLNHHMQTACVLCETPCNNKPVVTRYYQSGGRILFFTDGFAVVMLADEVVAAIDNIKAGNPVNFFEMATSIEELEN